MLKPVKVEAPSCGHLYEASNKIHRWYTLEQSIAGLEAQVQMLEAQLKATKETIEERKKLVHTMRMDAISCTDPVQLHLDSKEKDNG